MGSLCLEACSLLRDYSEGVPSNSPLAQKIKRAEAFLGDLYHEEFYPNTYNPRPDIISPEWSDKDETIIKTMCNEGNLKPSEIRRLNNLCYRVKQQNPTEEYNITGIGSKNAQGKLGEMTKNLKPVNEVLEQNSANKVEPKFKVGDWVIDKQGIVHQIANVIENVTYHTYGYDIVGGGYFNDNTEGVRLWTIQDAKEGDVLYMDNGLSTCIFIYKSIDNVVIQKYASCNKFGFEGTTYLVLNDGYVCPATKEQRDALMKAMADAGYTFDFEKKELKKIKQKPAWSEEDEERLDNAITQLKAASNIIVDDEVEDSIAFIKSLKDRVQPQLEQKWNEEDESRITTICTYLQDYARLSGSESRTIRINEYCDWLKSLRPQSHWKPSEEQLHTLEKATHIVGSKYKSCLKSLYQDLKKLTE